MINVGEAALARNDVRHLREGLSPTIPPATSHGGELCDAEAGS